MTIKSGDRMPSGTLKTMTKDGIKDVSTDELFKGKKVVLFSVPGAFTPTCDAKHLPGFVELAGQIKSKGVDTIACMAVNDVFVMNAWGKSSNVGDKVLMLADGNGDYAKALGLVVDRRGLGLGMLLGSAVGACLAYLTTLIILFSIAPDWKDLFSALMVRPCACSGSRLRRAAAARSCRPLMSDLQGSEPRRRAAA